MVMVMPHTTCRIINKFAFPAFVPRPRTTFGLKSRLSSDENLRSNLDHFHTTRNDYVNPEEKTKARDYIVKTFNDFGLDTWTEEFPSNQAKYPGINVIGRVSGRYTGTSKDKIVIIGAHYDTVKTTKGVDDNGSGISTLLQAIANYKSTSRYNAKCKQNHTLLFVAFDLEENQACANLSSCSCSGTLCGSGFFVKNLTRQLNGTGGTLQGAFILETIMNYNTIPNSQNLPDLVKKYLPTEYGKIQSNQFRGDFLAVIGRKDDDKALATWLVSNFDQGRFQAMSIPLPFNGKTTSLPSEMQDAMVDFVRSDHAQFWNSANSWPAVFITDTADFRGYMKTCYHEMCDDMDHVTPDMITFMGKTADALVGAVHKMTERDCSVSQKSYCNTDSPIKSNEETISSPSYPSEYPNGVNCSWIKKSEHPQMLEFMDFDLEESSNCTSDYVEVTTGATKGKDCFIVCAVGGERYCGSTKPQSISTSEKTVRVRFVSDAYVTKKGFKITWTTKGTTAGATRFY
ncbi:hypothetical protein QZH41_018366, partial [Actinostola sp. cb2023]